MGSFPRLLRVTNGTSGTLRCVGNRRPSVRACLHDRVCSSLHGEETPMAGSMDTSPCSQVMSAMRSTTMRGGRWSVWRWPKQAARANTWTLRTATDGDRRVLFDGKGEKEETARLNVVLVHPQIPGNVGSVARTCAATRVPLHLVGPLGFVLDDKKLKRAGLDYWPHVCVAVHDSWEEFYEQWQRIHGTAGARLIAFTKLSEQSHHEDGTYRRGDWLLFGSETTGLPEHVHEACARQGTRVRIPMVEDNVRSLNLAVSVGIGTYEALRQIQADVDA